MIRFYDMNEWGSLRATLYVDIGWNRETCETAVVSDADIALYPSELGGLRSAFKPYRGQVDLDGRIGIVGSAGRSFLGREYWIDNLSCTPVWQDVYCKGEVQHLRLNSQKQRLDVALSNTGFIVLEIVEKGLVLDSVNVPAKPFIREWFLAFARSQRVAHELGDMHALEQLVESFNSTCQDFRDAIGEQPFSEVVNSPISQVFAR